MGGAPTPPPLHWRGLKSDPDMGVDFHRSEQKWSMDGKGTTQPVAVWQSGNSESNTRLKGVCVPLNFPYKAMSITRASIFAALQQPVCQQCFKFPGTHSLLTPGAFHKATKRIYTTTCFFLFLRNLSYGVLLCQKVDSGSVRNVMSTIPEI